MNVRVVGEQFTWTFYYKDAAGKDVASPQLYVPRGKPVHFTVQSLDVIHDFWVPAFRMKIDAVPGIDTELRITPKTIGEYPVVCAELCGLGHSVMRQTAHVVEPAEFDSWLEKRAAGATAGGRRETGGGAGAPDGKAVFTDARLRRLPRAGRRRHDRRRRAPTSTRASPARTRRSSGESIVDPSADVTEGFSDGIMPPNFGDTLQPAELDALVKYLAEVTK